MEASIQEIIEAIEKLPKEKQFKCANDFNRWLFPDEIKHLKPDWWDNQYQGGSKAYLYKPVCFAVSDFFENKLGKKESLRYHNVRSLKWMTDAEFDKQFSHLK